MSALVILFLSVFACDRPEDPEPRLVLLYATCTVDKNFLEPYDAKISFTPNLERFAKHAVTFERHQTEAGSSGLAYASICSGTQADRHGVYRHPARLPESLVLIAEAYAREGYETFFWNGHGMASLELRYGQGIDAQNGFKRMLVAKDETFQTLLERLRSDPSYRAFVMTNFTLTHSPYRSIRLPRSSRSFPANRRSS